MTYCCFTRRAAADLDELGSRMYREWGANYTSSRLQQLQAMCDRLSQGPSVRTSRALGPQDYSVACMDGYALFHRRAQDGSIVIVRIIRLLSGLD